LPRWAVGHLRHRRDWSRSSPRPLKAAALRRPGHLASLGHAQRRAAAPLDERYGGTGPVGRRL